MVSEFGAIVQITLMQIDDDEIAFYWGFSARVSFLAGCLLSLLGLGDAVLAYLQASEMSFFLIPTSANCLNTEHFLPICF